MHILGELYNNFLYLKIGIDQADPLQPKVDKFFKNEKVTVTMTRETLMDAVVKMVVKDGASLIFFSNERFLQGVGELAKNVGLSLDPEMVGKYVLQAASRLRKEIAEEMSGKFVYLKFDCATRIRTNYIGINVRYVDEKSNAVTKTLMVADTKAQHISSELKLLLNKALKEFNLDWSKVLCCVTDNATNMIKIVKDCNEELAVAAAAGHGARVDEYSPCKW